MKTNNFKVKQKVKCIVDHVSTGVAVPKGTVYTISKLGKSGSLDVFYPVEPMAGGGFYYCHEFELVVYTKEELLNNIKEIQAELDSLKIKLRFVEENGLAEYDEDQFKVYETLQILKTKKTDIDKAKIIAELIKQ